MGPTDPLAGVMEAKPAIQPVTAPTREDLPNLTFSMIIQTIVGGFSIGNQDIEQ